MLNGINKYTANIIPKFKNLYIIRKVKHLSNVTKIKISCLAIIELMRTNVYYSKLLCINILSLTIKSIINNLLMTIIVKNKL